VQTITPDLIKDDLATALDRKIAGDLLDEFLTIRSDLSSKTLGRASPGKFIETFVQALQFLERGKYEEDPDVEKYLKDLDSRRVNFGDGLRICGSRLARAAYALRSKRNIVHKSEVRANLCDLRFLYSAAQWLLTELLREVTKRDVVEAERMIEFVQIPVSPLFEDFGTVRIIHDASTVEEELLILLGSHHPDSIPRKKVHLSLERRSKTAINGALSALWGKKLMHEDELGLILTAPGLTLAQSVAAKASARQVPTQLGKIL
jgi:hypothetical protein